MTSLPSCEGARWEEGPGGLPVLIIKTEQCEARMFQHGAHVATWTPAGQRPGLHLCGKSAYAPNKAIRGGIPVCYPWFGNRTDDPKPEGKASPAHGFARTRPWSVDEVSVEEENGQIFVEMSLPPDPSLWDGQATARIMASFGATLEVALEVENTSSEPCEFEAALHTYLEVGDVRECKIIGLEGTKYIDKVDGNKEKHWGREPLVLTDETDRVFMGTKNAIIVDDVQLQRHIRVEKKGSMSTVVWNPWMLKAQTMPDIGGDDWKSFLCVEAANVRPHQVPLPGGAVHTMSTRIQIIPQSRQP